MLAQFTPGNAITNRYTWATGGNADLIAMLYLIHGYEQGRHFSIFVTNLSFFSTTNVDKTLFGWLMN